MTAMNRSRFPDVLALAGLAGLLLLVHLKILTYVTGQDPMTYARLAFIIKDAPFSLAAWREVASFISPGYPAFLALVFSVFGVASIAWVNLFIVIAVFFLFYSYLRRQDLAPTPALAGSLAALWLTIHPYPLNAHFLFYAFRSAPQFFFVFLAFWLVDRARETSSRAGMWLVLSTLTCLIGAAFRETVLLAWPALALMILGHPGFRQRRIASLAWFAAPVALLVVAGALFYALELVGANHQARTWLIWLMNKDPGELTGLLRRGFDSWRLGTGWFGIALIAAGSIWAARRHILVFFVLSAVAFLLFYSGFIYHQRYLMDSTFMMALLGGMGAAWGASFLQERFASPFVRRLAGLAALAVAGGLVLSTAQSLPMWGPRVTLRDLHEFRRVIDIAGNTPARVAVDPRSLMLIDTLGVHLGKIPVYDFPREHLPPDYPGLFIEPVEERAQWTDSSTLEITEAIGRVADLLPVSGDEGRGQTVHLGEWTYRVYRVASWTQTEVSEPVTAKDVHGNLLWLDFRASDPDALREITLLDRADTPLRTWTIRNGNGLIPAFLESQTIPDGARLDVTSSSVMPARLIAAPAGNGAEQIFRLDHRRRFSALDWMTKPASLKPKRKWGAVFSAESGFSFPVPVGQTSGVYAATIRLQPRFAKNELAGFTYLRDGQVIASFTNELSAREIRHRIPITAPFEADRVPVQLRVRVADPFENHFRVAGLSFAASGSDE